MIENSLTLLLIRATKTILKYQAENILIKEKFFTNVIRCSRLRLWVGYFIYFNFTRVSSIVYQLLHLKFN